MFLVWSYTPGTIQKTHTMDTAMRQRKSMRGTTIRQITTMRPTGSPPVKKGPGTPMK